MASGSVVQVGNGVRHLPLPPFASELELNMGNDQGQDDIGAISHFPVTGGFLGSGQLAWRAAGPTVEIIDPSSGTRKAAWTFGAIMHNSGARVTTVCGVGLGTISQVAIGVDLGADRKMQGMLALLSLQSSRVTRVFHFTYKVTALAMVTGGEVSIDTGTLAPELRPWHGIIAIGTSHGTLHLLDLALDLGGHKVTSDELSPASLKSIITPDPQAERNRINAVRQHCHPVMCLSDGMSHGGRFQLIGPDDTVLFEMSSQLVTITALKFIPQLASLVVGYNIGAFQILNLSTLTIDCTSPYEEKVPPVHSFACQEPENDPKNFVYLWLCRSWSAADGSPERPEKQKRESQLSALCTLYAMNYDNKLWIEGHGLWYQGLASISPRFEFSATGGLGLKGQDTFPSCVFVAMTVRQTTLNSALTPGGSTGVSALATPDEDSGPVPEQSLCFFGWAGGMLEQGSVRINHYLAVFDINQWYQAQMPSSLKLLENHLCPYMSFHMLDRVPGCGTNGSGFEVVLGAAPKPASWSRHMTRTCNESDWYPSSLSYDSYVLTSEGLMEYQCQSAQQAALNYLMQCGPSAIVNPEEAYSLCLFSGLIPQENPPLTGLAMMSEREALLNVAIDEQLVSFLLQCVGEFAEGRFTSLGCSLPSLLEWAWSRVCTIKATNDSLCMPLFDADSGVMSPSSIDTLHQNLNSLASLTTIITTIRDYAQTNMITLQGAGELENRVQVVGLLMLHLSVVLWFYHCGLLTQDSGMEEAEEYHHVPFPADILYQIYKDRRQEIKKLSSTLKGNELLLIDGLLEDNAGGAGKNIDKTWIREDQESTTGSGSTVGIYPPPSLHALLDIFLLPSVSTTTKHRIVQYLFLDLASLLSDGYVRVVEELVKYPSSFSLSPSHIKLTQAFWLIDHQDFQEGLNVLLDPLVNTRDITPQQHQRIVKAFLYQGEHARALTYNQIRQPPRMDVDDIRLHLTLLLANGLIREAFHFQRQHRLKDNVQDLLHHLFTGCEQLGKLESIIHLPLSPVEENSLVTYLQTSRNKAANDYLLVYYLQRARYEDAALLQEGLHGGGGFGIERKRHGARTALIHGYLTHLPDVTKRLTGSTIIKPGQSRTVYSKPQPLSAKIHQAKYSPRSRAGMIEKMMDREEQAFSKQKPPPFTPFRNKMQRRQAYDYTDEDFVEISLKRKSSSRDVSRAVFPSRVMGLQSPQYEDEGESGLFSPAAKRTRTGESSLLSDDVKKLMDVALKKNVSYMPEEIPSPTQSISADLLSLLQTPKVTRKKRPSRVGMDSILIDTPQSILKVKQSIQRPMSPSAASDHSLPAFPRIASTSIKKNTTQDSIQSKASDSSLTPKQLRFHLPKSKVDLNSIANQSVTEAKESFEEDSLLTPMKLLEEECPISKPKLNGEAKTQEDRLLQGKALSVEKEDASELGGMLQLPEENEQSFMSIDMDNKYERSFEVQEEEEEQEEEERYERSFEVQEEGESSDAYEEALEEAVTEMQEGETSMEKSIEIEREPPGNGESDQFGDEAYESAEVAEVHSMSSGTDVKVSMRTEEYTFSSSDSVNVLRNPFSGVPSPRQPLPGYEAKRKSVTEKSQKAETDVVANDGDEPSSREATINETFYSVAEEEMSASKLLEDEEQEQEEAEASDGELVGAEKSFEVGEGDDNESVCEVEEVEGDVTLCEELKEHVENKVKVVSRKERETALETERENVDESVINEEMGENNKIQQIPETEELKTVVTEENNSRSSSTDVRSYSQSCIGKELEDAKVDNGSTDVKEALVENEEVLPAQLPIISQDLNDSECIVPLHFSDSESDGEEIEERVPENETEGICDVSKSDQSKVALTATLKDNLGMENDESEEVIASDEIIASVDFDDDEDDNMETEIEKAENVMQVVSQKEEEMITEALSEEEESLVLNLDASEHFSPLGFSDDSDQEEGGDIDQIITDNTEEVAITSRGEVREQISVDDSKVAIAEGAEENSMEANMPEEQSVEVCLPQEMRRVDELVPNDDQEPVIPAAEAHNAVIAPVEKPCLIEAVSDNHGDSISPREVLGNEISVLATSQSIATDFGVDVMDAAKIESVSFSGKMAAIQKDDHATVDDALVMESEKESQLRKIDSMGEAVTDIDSKEVEPPENDNTSDVETKDDDLLESNDNIIMQSEETETFRESQGNETIIPKVTTHENKQDLGDVEEMEDENIPVAVDEEEGKKLLEKSTEMISNKAPLAEEMDTEDSDRGNLREEIKGSEIVPGKMNVDLDSLVSVAGKTDSVTVETSSIAKEDTSVGAGDTEVKLSLFPSTSTRLCEFDNDSQLGETVADEEAKSSSFPNIPSQESKNVESSDLGIETSTGDEEVKPSSAQATPTRQRKKPEMGKSFEKDSESASVGEEGKPSSAPTTPTRRSKRLSPKKMESLDKVSESIEDTPIPATPTRRSTRSTPSKEDSLSLRLSTKSTPNREDSLDLRLSGKSTPNREDSLDLRLSIGEHAPKAKASSSLTQKLEDAFSKLENESSPSKTGVIQQASKYDGKPSKDDPKKIESPAKDIPSGCTSTLLQEESSKVQQDVKITKTSLDDDRKISVDTPKKNVNEKDPPETAAREPEVATPRRRSTRLSLSHDSLVQSPSVIAKEMLSKVAVEQMIEIGSTTPVRRSRRLSSAAVTPGTPKRQSKKLDNESMLEVTPPVQKGSRSRSGAMVSSTTEKPPKSTRKISDVPTPLTKPTSTPGASLATPRRSTRSKAVLDEVNKVSQKLLLSPDRNVPLPKSPNKESASIPSTSTSAMLPTPPSSPSQKSKSKAAESVEAGISNIKSPVRRSSRRRSISIEPQDSEVATKMSEEKKDSNAAIEEKLQSPDKKGSKAAISSKTPKRSTPSKKSKTPSRHAQGFETLETISEDSEMSTRIKPPHQVETPSRSTRSQSASVALVENVEERSTPSHGKLQSTTGGETSPESKGRTPARRGRRSLDSESTVNRESTPSLPEEPAQEVQLRRSTRKRRVSSRVSESEDEVFRASTTPSKSLLKSSKALKKSLASSPMSSVKDSESEDEEILKKRVSRRSLRVSNIPSIDDVLAGPSKGRTTLSLSSRLSVSTRAARASTRHHSKDSLKILPEDESSLLMTPEKPKRKSRAAKKRVGADDSILIIKESDESEENIPKSGVDTVEEEEEDIEAEFTESPEMDLNLIDEKIRGVQPRRGALALKLRTSGKRRSSMLRRSVHALKMPTESPNSQADVELEETSKVKKPRRSSGRSVRSETTILELHSEKEVDTDDRKDGQISHSDIENKKLPKNRLDTVKEKNIDNEGEAAPLTTEFIFAEPKPLISAKQSRALQSLMGEAVEFLFSPPQPQGRIVKSHKKVGTSSSESEKAGSSSESEKARSSSESESELPKRRTSRRRK